MRPMRRALLTLAALVLMVPALVLSAAEKTFTPDTVHTRLGFTAKTIFKVAGVFDKYTVEASGDPATLKNAKVKIVFDATSINTDNKTRDEHLQSPDFFDVAKFPNITFTSSKISKKAGKIMVQGSLDMHGVKKDVTIPFELTTGKNGAGNDTWTYDGSVKINRNDWGVGTGSIAAKISLKDTVELNLQLVGFFHEDESAKSEPAPAKAPVKKHKKAA